MIQIYVSASVITAMQFVTIKNNLFEKLSTLLVLHLIAKAQEFDSQLQNIPIFSII